MNRSGTKIIFIFTKDMKKHTIELQDVYNEIVSVNGGFSVIEVSSIDLKQEISQYTGKNVVSISLRNKDGSIIAKDFINDFKDDDNLVFQQGYSSMSYRFKKINGGFRNE